MTTVNLEWAAYWRSLLRWHTNDPANNTCACGDPSTDCRIRKVAVKKGILANVTDNIGAGGPR